jgi:hypothetical protein
LRHLKSTAGLLFIAAGISCTHYHTRLVVNPNGGGTLTDPESVVRDVAASFGLTCNHDRLDTTEGYLSLYCQEWPLVIRVFHHADGSLRVTISDHGSWNPSPESREIAERLRQSLESSAPGAEIAVSGRREFFPFAP